MDKSLKLSIQNECTVYGQTPRDETMELQMRKATHGFDKSESSSCLFTFTRMALHLAANFGDTFKFYSPIDYPFARSERNPYRMDHFSSKYNVGSTCFGV